MNDNLISVDGTPCVIIKKLFSIPENKGLTVNLILYKEQKMYCFISSNDFDEIASKNQKQKICNIDGKVGIITNNRDQFLAIAKDYISLITQDELGE